MKNDIQVHLGGRKKANPAQIMMLKADTNYTIIYFIDGTIFMSATTLGILEERLRGYNFYRTHRSTLINLAYISELNKRNKWSIFPELNLKNNIEIPIARRKIHDFMKAIQLIQP
jgi:DNA-binding LytR/AlgR family response regulator